MKNNTDTSPGDADLIHAYLQNGDQAAFSSLLNRYYGLVFSIISKSLGSGSPDVEDLVQSVWFKVIDNLSRYEDSGRFAAFVGAIARNVVTDFWRKHGVRDKSAYKPPEDEEVFDLENQPDSVADTYAAHAASEELAFFVEKLIPSLPCEQRTVFLLKHESEYWEGQKRLGWEHIAELSDMTPENAWRCFESARRKLCAGDSVSANCEETGVFLVWTQAHRLDKSKKYTERYFADLLGIPVNTLKTRYRAAIKALTEGMSQWRQAA